MVRRIICNHKFDIDSETIWEASVAEIVVDTDKKIIIGYCDNEKGDILFIINYRAETAIIMVQPDEIIKSDIKRCNFGLSNSTGNLYKNCKNWEDIMNFIKEVNLEKHIMVKNESVIWKELELLEIEDVCLYGNVKINIETGDTMVNIEYNYRITTKENNETKIYTGVVMANNRETANKKILDHYTTILTRRVKEFKIIETEVEVAGITESK